MSGTQAQVRTRGVRSRPNPSRTPYAEPPTSTATRRRARQGQRQRRQSPPSPSTPSTEIYSPNTSQPSGSTSRFTGGDDERVDIPSHIDSTIPVRTRSYKHAILVNPPARVGPLTRA